MTPVIQHLGTIFPDLPLTSTQASLNWTFDENIKTLGPDFYQKVIPLHPILNLEYSILCNQLRHNFLFPQHVNHDQVVDRLVAALALCELLEHVHLHYLIVPREVVRLRKQKQHYRTLLTEMAGYTFSSDLLAAKPVEPVEVGLSLSQQIREMTVQANWYRILLNRCKRILTLLTVASVGSEAFQQAVRAMDQFTNPYFAHLGWIFHAPRLLTNLSLTAKHTIPGPWMGDKEKAIDWKVRFLAQAQRRWFELSNDALWIVIGLSTCFALVGALAPVALYLSVIGFAIDVANAATRAYIELKRLYLLQDEYQTMLLAEDNDENKKMIQEYQEYITHRISFEKQRFALHVSGTIAILGAMSLAIPIFALNPIIPLIGAIFLLLLWAITFVLTRKLDDYRPKDTIEVPANVSKLGFFARKDNESSPLIHTAQCYDAEEPSSAHPIFI